MRVQEEVIYNLEIDQPLKLIGREGEECQKTEGR